MGLLVLVLLVILGYEHILPEPAVMVQEAMESGAASSAPQSNRIEVSVDRVIDGDTFVAKKADGQLIKVRLLGIDTPETKHPKKDPECFGVEASAFLSTVLTNVTVSLETDATQDRVDRYNRMLAYVFLKDGTNVNEDILRQGYGREYTYNTAYEYQGIFKEAEQEAKDARRGVWSDVCM